MVWGLRFLILFPLKATYADFFIYASALKGTIVDIIRMYSSTASFAFLKHHNIANIKLQTVKDQDITFP